ncbi:hypothetical protein [Ramlibacter rhizophilus]|uniref:Uncharacterized protein n=1 Tax=Ramlibacter rhizophilus TaxID=1781167 RepID=A0A4Z0BZL1_9BURK|nr:hypothetical protein [Ramlibacter rhizophilus]TFZ03399.1 hypothetical protein EZ242_05820 [Ramlibacter rhizophilus]
MTTAFSFTQRLSVADIPAPAQSVGAHLAAKLQIFQTDERTLTDELCDMMCIWLGMQTRRSPKSVKDFTLTLSKTTTAEEVKNGADLELLISSPLGSKRCLIQAKVLDPVSKKLRCDTTAGWKKLRRQLVAARDVAGDLAFLLIYIPGELLNGNGYGFGTYEQHDHFVGLGPAEAFHGATLIAVDDLLGKTGRWRDAKRKVPQIAPGQFKAGVPFWQLFMELLLCRRSSWTRDAAVLERHAMAFRTLRVEASEPAGDDWTAVQRDSDDWLPPGPQRQRG